MAKIITLKDHKTNELAYPQTVSDAVYMDNGSTLEQYKESVSRQFANYPNVTVTGTVTNLPDNEDIRETEQHTLQLADRNNLEGMGYVILRKNKSFAEQVIYENTIYEIRYDFDLGGETIDIPNGSLLKFNGGVLSNGTLSGNIKNKVLESSWFGDDNSFLSSMNSLTGFSVVEFEKKTYTFNDVISISNSASIRGNGATLTRSDITNVSEPFMSIHPTSRIEYLEVENLHFDGGVDNRVMVIGHTHRDVISISNIDNVKLRNLYFSRFNNPSNQEEEVREDYSNTSNCFIQVLGYENLHLNGIKFKNSKNFGEVVSVVPKDTSESSNCVLIVENSVFDFTNERCYSALNCFGGRLVFRNNEIYNVIGGLNSLFVNNSFIYGNLYKDSDGGFVDLDEQYYFGKASHNVFIFDNVLEGMGTYRGSCNALEAVRCENVFFQNNYFNRKEKIDGENKRPVFKLSDGCKNVYVTNNTFNNVNYTFYANSGVIANTNIVFEDNRIYGKELDNSIFGVFQIGTNVDGMTIENNQFDFSTESSSDGVNVFTIRSLGQNINGLVIRNNNFELTANINNKFWNLYSEGNSENPSYSDLIITGNRFDYKKTAIINNANPVPELSNIQDNGKLYVEETLVGGGTIIIPVSYNLVVDHYINLGENVSLTFGIRTVLEFKNDGSLIGNVTLDSSTLVIGVPFLGNSYLDVPSRMCNSETARPEDVPKGTMYFDTTLNQPIWYKGNGAWVDATGAEV